MKVLIVGGGGREHALVWKIAQSPCVSQVYCAPGNGGTEGVACNVPLEVGDLPGLRRFASREGIGLTVVGPELPLTLGLVNEFERCGLRAFGPSREAAELEGSKAFAKEVMGRAGIPTAAHVVVDDPVAAEGALQRMGAPIVVKADGLAGGKGVVVCLSLEEARAAVRAMLVEGSLGEAGRRLVLEELLEGEEASYLCLSDGRTVLPLAPCQDHKALRDGDRGPNTGGMGAVSPVAVLEGESFDRVTREIALPVVRTLAALGRPYRGVLYIGLMMTAQGPKVLEFNARFGDPEAQPLVMRMESDLVPFLEAVAVGNLADAGAMRWREEAAVCVVMASQGYPGPYPKGRRIEGLGEIASWPDIVAFHAGTRREGDRFFTDGGRVVAVTGRAAGLEAAIQRVYRAVGCIRWEGAQYRTDIGQRALSRARRQAG